MPFISIGTSRFYYELHGQGEPLVLIAGLKGDHTYWIPVLDQLASRYQVLIYDSRGTGQTTDTETALTIERMADDVIQLSEVLGLQKPHIVGHSMGGAVAQVIGKNYPDAARTLVMSNSLMKFNPVAEIIFQETLALYQQDKSATVIMEHLAPHIFSKAFYTPALIDFIRRVTANNPYPQTQQGFERQLAALRLFDSREWIGEITLPTLLIASTEDKISPLSESEQMAEKIKNARLYITDTGHASFVEAPKLFCQAINEFIAA